MAEPPAHASLGTGKVLGVPVPRKHSFQLPGAAVDDTELSPENALIQVRKHDGALANRRRVWRTLVFVIVLGILYGLWW